MRVGSLGQTLRSGLATAAAAIDAPGHAVQRQLRHKRFDTTKRRSRYEKPPPRSTRTPKGSRRCGGSRPPPDCKPRDLDIEGLRMVLRQHGRAFDALNRGV